MKIVISGYIGKKITGIGRNLICLLDNAQSDTKYIIYTNADMVEEFRFSNPNVTVKSYPISKNSSMKNLLWTTFLFPFMALKEHADKALIPNFTLLLFKFVPTTVILHDLIEFNVPKKFSKKKMFYRTKLADPITARVADKIITVSENSKRDIQKFLGIKTDKISVVYNGVDQQKFRRMDSDRAKEILDDRKWPDRFILYVGTVDHPGKNAMNVIKAYEGLRKKGKYHGKLVIVGMPGAGYEVIENYVKESAYQSDIIMTGYVSDEELVAFYSACDVFCFVSLYEGFGIPPLEALSCGAPVIVSNTSSLPEVVGSVGITIDPTDVTELEEKIILVTEGNWTANREKVSAHLEKFNWKNLSIEFEQSI